MSAYHPDNKVMKSVSAVVAKAYARLAPVSGYAHSAHVNTMNVNRARSGKHLYLGSLRVGHTTTHVVGVIDNGIVFLGTTHELCPETIDDVFIDAEECTDLLAIATIAFAKYTDPKGKCVCDIVKIAWRARDCLM
jgi:hypothetical protein